MTHIHAGEFGTRFAVNCEAAKAMPSIDRHNLKYVLPMGGYATKASIAQKGAEITCPSCIASCPTCAVCSAPAFITFDSSMMTWEAGKPACIRCYEEREEPLPPCGGHYRPQGCTREDPCGTC